MCFEGRCQIDCKLSRCTISSEDSCDFGRKQKKRKQLNAFSSENETDQNQSKSSLFAPKTKTKSGRSLLLLVDWSYCILSCGAQMLLKNSNIHFYSLKVTNIKWYCFHYIIVSINSADMYDSVQTFRNVSYLLFESENQAGIFVYPLVN